MSKRSYKTDKYICDNCEIIMQRAERTDISLNRYHATEEYANKGENDLYADDNDYLWVSVVIKKYRQPFEFEFETKDFCCAACAQEFLEKIKTRDEVVQERRQKYSRTMGHSK